MFRAHFLVFARSARAERAKDWLRSLLDLGIEKDALPASEMRRVRTIAATTLAMIGVALLTAIQCWVFERWDVVAYLGVATTAGCANLWKLRSSQNPQLAAHIALGTLAALISASAFTAGGFYNPSFSWLYILPLAAAVALDVRGAAKWGGVTIAITIGFWLLGEAGVHLRDQTPIELQNLGSLIARVLTICALGGIGLGFVVGMRRTQDELERESTYLELVMHAAVAANEARSFRDALEEALGRICASMGWAAGHVLEVAEDGTSRSMGLVHLGPASDRAFDGSDLERISLERAFPAGVGLPGRAVESRRPQIATSEGWRPDREHGPGRDRAIAAQAMGLEAAFAVPVLVHGKARAVLEFGSQERIPDPTRILEVFTHIGRQLGRVAERTDLQDRLRQTQKMEAVGQLAAGLAHEINNPMSFVRSNLHTLRELSSSQPAHSLPLPSLPLDGKPERDSGDFQELIDESLEGVERTISIVRDVMHFSRLGGAGPEHFELADVNELLRDSLRVATSDLPSEIRCNVDTAHLPAISCSPNGLRQVFLNLIVNAIQALEGTGTLGLQTRLTADEIVVQVEDDGPGLSAQHRERLFDPFFTTKPVGEGTGLGLTVSYEIVQTHGGTIHVESEPGRGAIFEVRLPR